MDEQAFDSALLLASDMTCNRSVTLTEVLRAAIAAYLEASGEARPTHRHRKGGLYQVLMRGVHEKDLQPVVIYRATSDGAVWVRYASEFDDGRFTPIDTAMQEGK